MSKFTSRPRSYVGVQAPTPPNFLREKRDPTQRDNKNYNIGDIWLTNNERLFMLFDLNGGLANWVELYPAGASAASQFPADVGIAVAVNNSVNVYGGNNINTAGVGNDLTINLDDNVSLIGTLSIPILGEGIVTVDGAGLIGSSAGTDGQVIIGATGAAPDWGNITSSDGSVVVVEGPNSIDLRAVGGGGGGGISQFDADIGSALPAMGIINVYGGTNINTDAAVDTMYINLDDNVSLAGSLTISTFTDGVVVSDATGLLSYSAGTDGQVLIGSTAGVPAWNNVISSDGTITITDGANSIDLTVTGGAPVGTVTGISDDIGGVATPAAGIIQIAGGDNINTALSGMSVITVNLDESIYQPVTNAAGTQGLYALGGLDFMHAYGGDNTFLGIQAGNRTLTTADYNVGIGSSALSGLTTGEYNTAVGSNAGSSITDSDYNTAIGSAAFESATTSNDYNTAIGYEAMGGVINNNSSNVGIGYRALYANTANGIVYNTVVGSLAAETLVGGDGNVILGYNAANNLVGGDENIIIGYNSGSAYTGIESNNILIGSNLSGVLGDSDTIRIGVNGTHDRTYIAGVYDGTVTGSVPKLVGVDSTGKLGALSAGADGQVLIGSGTGAAAWANITSTGGTINITNGPGTINLEVSGAVDFTYSFLGLQAANVANVTGDNTTYFIGFSSALTEIFDTGNNYNPGGGGVPATFTAPIDGIYYLECSILVTSLAVTTTYTNQLEIITDNRTYSCYNTLLGSNATQSIVYSTMADMSAGHTATFRFRANVTGSGKTVGVGATDTFVCGHLIRGT